MRGGSVESLGDGETITEGTIVVSDLCGPRLTRGAGGASGIDVREIECCSPGAVDVVTEIVSSDLLGRISCDVCLSGDLPSRDLPSGDLLSGDRLSEPPRLAMASVGPCREAGSFGV